MPLTSLIKHLTAKVPCSVSLWLLILERAWFVRIVWPGRARALVAEWDARSDCRSWRAKKIREATVSQVSLELHALLPLIQVLVALCPLLGLLGTVLGMIGVFEVISVSGNDDAQAMARGVRLVQIRGKVSPASHYLRIRMGSTY